MFPVINIGPLAIQTPGLLLLAGLWIGLTAAEKQAAYHQIESNHLYNLVLAAILAGMAGGRLAYVLQFPAAFAQDPLSILSPNPALFDPPAGAALGALAAVVYASRRQMLAWKTLDALTSFLTVMMIAIGGANLASGDAYGMPAQIPWAIPLWGEARHPTQVYEILLGTVILILTQPSRFRARQAAVPGMRFWTFAALASLARLFLEAFRGDSVLLLEHIRLPQVAAWLGMAVSLWQIYMRLRNFGQEEG